jgi:hypothetical protein
VRTDFLRALAVPLLAALGACGDAAPAESANSLPVGTWRADLAALKAEIDGLPTQGVSGPDLERAKEIFDHWRDDKTEFVVREDGRGEVRSTVGPLNFHLEPTGVGVEPRTWELVYRLKFDGVEHEARGFTMRERGERLEIVSRMPITQLETTLYLVRSSAR